jgi:hypothetical protein
MIRIRPAQAKARSKYPPRAGTAAPMVGRITFSRTGSTGRLCKRTRGAYCAHSGPIGLEPYWNNALRRWPKIQGSQRGRDRAEH